LEAIVNPISLVLSNLFTVLTTPVVLVPMLLIAVLFSYDILSKGWRQSLTHRALAACVTSFGIMVLNVLFAPITFFMVAILQAGYTSLGLPSVPVSFWDGMPFLATVLIAIAAYDFADYWNHRLMHNSWLWPIHAIHHSDDDVNGFTTFRIHFLETVVMRGSYIVMLSWVGFSPEVASAGAVFIVLHNVYVHAKLDWDHGPFKLLIASPHFHRWHHADVEEAFGKNLANIIPFYDYAFGTYYDPGKCDARMGAQGVPPADMVALTLYPFSEWTKAIRGKIANRSEFKTADQPKASQLHAEQS